MKITFFGQGSTMAFDEGKQVAEAQEPWVLVFAEYLESVGIDPTEQLFELPGGRRAKIIKNDGILNWTFDY